MFPFFILECWRAESKGNPLEPAVELSGGNLRRRTITRTGDEDHPSKPAVRWLASPTVLTGKDVPVLSSSGFFTGAGG